MKNKIPKGWIDYLPYGDKVEGTKLFPFKTPLKLEHQSNVPKLQRFTPACLIANRPKLKAVIDLTDTQKADRYYRPQDFIDANIEHLKMRISGGGWVPGSDKIRQFSDAVDGFLKKYADDPDALIGVHCTHGLNRTGYFICMYMVTRMSCDPFEAIDKFQKARGYEMYRQNFIEEIKEPGRHSNGSQTLNYGREDEKKVRRVGDYSYENFWLESSFKKPFKGFSEWEIRHKNNVISSRYRRSRDAHRAAHGMDGVEPVPMRNDAEKPRRTYRRPKEASLQGSSGCYRNTMDTFAPGISGVEPVRCFPSIPENDYGGTVRSMGEPELIRNDVDMPYRRPEDASFQGSSEGYRDAIGNFAHGTSGVGPMGHFPSIPHYNGGIDRNMRQPLPRQHPSSLQAQQFFRFPGFAPATDGYPPGPGQFHLGMHANQGVQFRRHEPVQSLGVDPRDSAFVPVQNPQEDEQWTEVKGRHWTRRRFPRNGGNSNTDEIQYRSPLEDDMPSAEKKKRYDSRRCRTRRT